TQSFQRLQQYSQAINQSVLQYHTHVLQLCQDANPDMDERTKVQYLMANLLPSLKMKVISKDPHTTDRFLQIARKAEDLQALVNQDERMNSNDSIGTTSNVNFSSAPYVAPPLRHTNNQKQQYTQQQQPRSQLETATDNIPITESVLPSQQ
ncbi:unnamed protein product, partial [Didymodactylos carnosus]